MGFDFLIPISTYPDPTPKDGLRRALNLAAKLTGRLTAVVHEVEIAPVHGLLRDMILDVGKMVAEAEARSKARGADIASWLEERADRLRCRSCCRQSNVGRRRWATSSFRPQGHVILR